MNKKLQVFISSTYTDLIEERQAAVEAVLSAGHIPAGMELFTAGDQSQKEIIKEWIEESDVYMLILGGRYGSIDKETGKSYTHWEYDYASEVDKPRFSLVLTDEAINNKIKVVEDHTKVLEQDNPQLYKEFKNDLMSSKLVNRIEDIKDIENSILKSLRKIERSSHLHGWVSGKDVPDVKVLLEENANLLRENLKLISENQKLKEQKDKNDMYNGYSYEEVTKYLENTIIDISQCPFYQDEAGEVSLDILFKRVGNYLVNGFSIHSNMHKDASFIHRSICPHLLKFELMERIKGTGKNYDRLLLTKIGKRYLAKLEIEDDYSIENKKNTKAPS